MYLHGQLNRTTFRMKEELKTISIVIVRCCLGSTFPLDLGRGADCSASGLPRTVAASFLHGLLTPSLLEHASIHPEGDPYEWVRRRGGKTGNRAHAALYI